MCQPRQRLGASRQSKVERSRASQSIDRPWVPFPGPRRAEKDYSHLRPRVDAPRSLAFLISPSYWCATRWLWTWATVSIVTLTAISKEVPPSTAPNRRRNAEICNQDLRKQTDSSQIQRTHGRNSRQDIVDVLCRLRAWASPGQEASVFAQIVGRVLRIEHHCGVEETKEDDQHDIEEHMQWLTITE